MAVEKNIVMKEFNGTDYDTLYPKTIGTQVDGVFTSEQTLTSNTLAKYQLSASAVPDDVFAFLGKYAQYWWRRRSIIFEPNVATSGTRIYFSNGYVDPNTVYYSTEIDSTSDGKPVLKNPQSLVVPTGTSSGALTILQNANLGGKYVKNILYRSSVEVSDEVYLLPSNPSFQFDSGLPYTIPAYKVTFNKTFGDWEYVQSNNRNAYPDSGESGGYEYEYLGVPFDKLPTVGAVEIGSYVGTSTYGQNNPNTLTFSKKPKLIILGPTNTGNSVTAGIDNTCIILFGITTNFTFGSSDSINHISYSENTMSWYNDNSATYQRNYKGYKYYYIVIY